ncbi:hypothetical protein BT96DRAFT_420222 [Gymnopus androsaceus JB14]|uniref:Uncharacterized protein n=1 Tax=Gymnopus androsaceus JB14 TaxID=1447944 RepID=A0A6A4I298_9AGAR|nr:hypothetical protein BT96DRAFT_420222 [Gymnopus androsaceus JB14]
MAPSTAKLGLFQPRTTNFADVRRTLRSEYGSAVESEEEISRMLATVDQDLDDCRAEIDRMQSEIHPPLFPHHLSRKPAAASRTTQSPLAFTPVTLPKSTQ